jgi:hypothetical protein
MVLMTWCRLDRCQIMGNGGGKEDIKEAEALEKSRRVDKSLVSFKQVIE